MKKNIKSLILSIALPLLAGGLSSLISGGGYADYQAYIKPPLSPPGIVFPIVWSTLYTLMGISFYLINQKGEKEKQRAVRLYYFQLFLNFIWPIIFFSLSAYTAAAFVLVLLIITVIRMIIAFSKLDKRAALLNIPYLLWLLFALYLNIAIAVLN